MAEQRIGKYRILERIGRGGMGMIYKAHDPILDRLVALKVISSEVEVTDELRARFFREAQACAKLNHPNIVTVFDMGEDDGRLFIVMELLEGQELRRFITPRTLLPLEDKLSVMVQACGGLHYAHQKGVVHRDIKPGNIFLLGNGQVKILDFGIAHMASTEGLTRTGLIMGTLRYISPEQVRGRSDHRSDMFSLGSVFYELLTSRPPFTGDDPMHLLEQLRTEDPPSLNEVDASIPPALTSIVQRAMRKDPEERFHDLDEMRTELEYVQRGLNEERQRVSARVRGQRERIVQLQAAVAERLGMPGQDAEIPGIDQRQGLVVIQALEGELEGRIAALEAEIAQVEAVSPAVQRAEAAMKAGRYQEAVAQFEAIVAELPDLRRAREGLERARVEAEGQQRRYRGTELRDKARAALTERRFALCLEIVKESSELGLPADLAQELASLRERALAEQEALRRRLQEAEEASRQSAAARTTAQAEEAAQYAPGRWNEAQALVGAAEASLRRGAYAEAKEGFERATAAYHGALDAARQAQVEERRTAERARDAATLGQQQARGVGAEQYARELWDAGEGKFGEAQEAFARKTPGLGAVMFREASALYRQAEEVARNASERERRRAEAARERASEGRRSAAALGAEGLAPSIWQEAESKTAAGEAAWLRQQYAKATEAFEGALRQYHQAQAQVREAARRHREESARKQQEVAARRRSAVEVEAAVNAVADWAAAEASAAAAETALERNAWEEASADLDRAADLYRAAEASAREVQQARSDADRADAASGVERKAAAAAEASTRAAEPWKAAEGVQARAVAALSQQRYTSARALFGEAEKLYAQARRAAGVAAEAEAKARQTAAVAKIPTSPVRRPPVGALDETVLFDQRATPPPAEVPIGRRDTVSMPPETWGRVSPGTTAHDETIVLDRVRPPVDATVLSSAGSGAGEVAVPSGREADDIPAPSTEAKRPAISTPAKRPTLRTVLIGAGAVVAIAVVAVTWWLRPSDPVPVAPVPAVRSPQAKSPAPVPPPAPQREADRAAALVAAARAEAIKAGSESLAPARFITAGEKERAGSTALKRDDTATAEQRYQEALAAYRLAKTEALDTADKRSEAGKAERRAADARQTAERVSASKLAPSPWNKGTMAQGRAEEALKLQAFPRATGLFTEAQQAYDDATRQVVSTMTEAARKQEAEKQEAQRVEAQRLEAQRLEAQRVEAQRLEAQKQQAQKQEAQRVEAQRLETQRLEAQRLEAQRLALQKQEAQKQEAQKQEAQRQETQRLALAERERQRQGELVAVARRGVEQSRSRMVARREDAAKADAGRLAKSIFDAAEKKQAEAETLVGRQSFSDADHRYQDATELYFEAKVRAEAITEAKKQADGAKTQMLTEKQRASTAAPEYAEAQNEERQGNALYERSSYNEAAEKYRSTAMLYMKAKTAPSPVRPPTSPPPPPPPPGRPRLPPSF